MDMTAKASGPLRLGQGPGQGKGGYDSAPSADQEEEVETQEASQGIRSLNLLLVPKMGCCRFVVPVLTCSSAGPGKLRKRNAVSYMMPFAM